MVAVKCERRSMLIVVMAPMGKKLMWTQMYECNRNFSIPPTLSPQKEHLL
jgi:hypothetical protein